jgi:hypothetical protein
MSLAGTGCPRSECRWPKGDRKAGRHARSLRWDSRITGRIQTCDGLASKGALTWTGGSAIDQLMQDVQTEGKVGRASERT